MNGMELVDFELAFKQAASAHKKVGWVSVFNKTIIHFFKSFNFKAKAFSFCLFYMLRIVILRGEASKNPITLSSGSFDFVLRTSLRMTA
jgi:hypothetical protein